MSAAVSILPTAKTPVYVVNVYEDEFVVVDGNGNAVPGVADVMLTNPRTMCDVKLPISSYVTMRLPHGTKLSAAAATAFACARTSIQY